MALLKLQLRLLSECTSWFDAIRYGFSLYSLLRPRLLERFGRDSGKGGEILLISLKKLCVLFLNSLCKFKPSRAVWAMGAASTWTC